jgi:transglutaminase-like putative cysteine protease
MAGNAAQVLQFPARPDGRWDYRFGAPNRRFPLPDGDPGIARTVQMMTGLARGSEGANHPTVRQKAVEVVRGFSSRDKQGQINAILDWVKKNVDFRGEYKELLQTPVVTIQIQAGDCDDHSMLISSLLKTLGFSTRFNTVAADPTDPEQFTHVFCEVLDPTTQQWTALDSTVKNSFPGWRPPNVYREKAWRPVNGLGDGFLSPSTPGTPDLTTELFGLAQPIDQALAYKIAGTTPIVGDFNFGNLFSSTTPAPELLGLPWWGVALIAIGAIWVLNRR